MHLNWTDDDWSTVLFSDESRFFLSSDCKCNLIWREVGNAYCHLNILERYQHVISSILVCEGILFTGRTFLCIDQGSMTDRRCTENHPHVWHFRGAVGEKFRFMENNASCHCIHFEQNCLEVESIHGIDWSARSPDLNFIEKVRDFGNVLLL